MAAPNQTDYADLAKQFGGTSVPAKKEAKNKTNKRAEMPDYAVLAKQHGGVTLKQTKPQAEDARTAHLMEHLRRTPQTDALDKAKEFFTGLSQPDPYRTDTKPADTSIESNLSAAAHAAENALVTFPGNMLRRAAGGLGGTATDVLRGARNISEAALGDPYRQEQVTSAVADIIQHPIEATGVPSMARDYAHNEGPEPELTAAAKIGGDVGAVAVAGEAAGAAGDLAYDALRSEIGQHILNDLRQLPRNEEGFFELPIKKPAETIGEPVEEKPAALEQVIERGTKINALRGLVGDQSPERLAALMDSFEAKGQKAAAAGDTKAATEAAFADAYLSHLLEQAIERTPETRLLEEATERSEEFPGRKGARETKGKQARASMGEKALVRARGEPGEAPAPNTAAIMKQLREAAKARRLVATTTAEPTEAAVRTEAPVPDDSAWIESMVPSVLATIAGQPPAPPSEPPADAAVAPQPTPVPQAVLYHGSPRQLNALQPGTMLTADQAWAAGYATTGAMQGRERFSGSIYAAGVPEGNVRNITGSLHEAEQKLLDLGKAIGATSGGLKGIAEAVQKHYGYDAIVAKDKDGKVTGAITLKEHPITGTHDPVEAVREAIRQGMPVASNLEAILGQTQTVPAPQKEDEFKTALRQAREAYSALKPESVEAYEKALKDYELSRPAGMRKYLEGQIGQAETPGDIADIDELNRIFGLMDLEKPDAGADFFGPVWYLKSERAIQDKMKGPMRGPDALRMLENNGVSPDELKWTGLDEYLRNAGRVTPQQVRDFITQNAVKIEEIRKGPEFGIKTREEWAQEEYSKPYAELDPAAQRWVDTMTGVDERTGTGTHRPRYESHVLQGGDNYREVLLTVPQKTSSLSYTEGMRLRELNEKINGMEKDEDQQAYMQLVRERNSLLDKDTLLRNSAYKQNFRSGHWDEANVLVHVRMNDRMTPDGKKLLHMEELQSDWHQKGRRQGYVDPEAVNRKTAAQARVNASYEPARDAIERNGRLGYDTRTEAFGAVRDHLDWAERWDVHDAKDIEAINEYATAMRALMQEERAGNEGVPDAPFKKNWQEMALRRMIRYAAENGYDGVSWTGGEAQAERYDLSNHIGKLEWNPGTKFLTAYDPSGNKVIDQEVDRRQLPNYIGKEATDKLQPQIEEWEHDTNPNLTPYKDLNESYKWTILDGNGDPLHDSGGSLLTFNTERHANEEIDRLKEEQQNQIPVPKLEGLDLKVGGEGMRGFYDKIVPEYLNKFGKKFGARVENIETGSGKYHIRKVTHPRQGGPGYQVVNPDGSISNPFLFKDYPEAAADVAERNQRLKKAFQYFPITPAMRESVVKEGMSLFNLGKFFGRKAPVVPQVPPASSGPVRERPSIILRETLPGAKEHAENKFKNASAMTQAQNDMTAADQDWADLLKMQLVSDIPPPALHKFNQQMAEVAARRKALLGHMEQLRQEAKQLERSDPNVGEVRLDAQGNPTLWVNKTGMYMIKRAMNPNDTDQSSILKGSEWSAAEARWVRDRIATTAPIDNHEERVGRPLTRLIDAAIGKAGNGGVTLMGKTGLGIQSAIGTMREELLHRWQRSRSEQGLPQNHLSPNAFLNLFSAMPKAAYDFLKENGYDEDRGGMRLFVIEATAKIMAGKWRKMGLTKPEAARYLAQYFAAVTNEHGIDAVLEIEHTNGMARDFQKEVERLYGPGTQAGAGTAETTIPKDSHADADRPIQRMDRGRSEEAGGDAAGRTGGGITETPEFKRWFGDSKVLDENGKPLTLYHGTTRKNPKILDESFEAGFGIFLTDNDDVASTFTLPREYGEPVYEDEDGEEIEPGDVVPLYARIENPLVIDDEDEEYEGPSAQEVSDDTGLQARTLKAAKAAGHDGVILRNVKEGIGERHLSDTYIVFDPKQVKHAERNKGAFDPESANILKDIERKRGREFNREAYKTPEHEYRGKNWHPEETKEEMRERHRRRHEWEQSALAALSTGELTPEEAEKQDIHTSPRPDKFEPLPPKLFHVTTAADAVEAEGIKPRWELEMEGAVGLGGGSDYSVSFTTDLNLARDIEKGLQTARKVAAGEITVEDLVEMVNRGEGAPRPFMGEFEKALNAVIGGSDPLGHALRQEVSEHAVFGKPEKGEGWEPDKSAYHWTGGDGVERYARWVRPMTEKEKAESRWRVFKAFSPAREWAGGQTDPLFIWNDVEALGKIDPRQIAILFYKPEPGARGTFEPGMAEWRVYSGRAVKLVERVE